MEALLSALNASGVCVASPGAQALFHELGAHSCPPDLIHISSAGGCGSSHLSSFLNREGFSTNLQDDRDGLRHCCRPPPWPAKACPRCVVHLYCDPLEAAASHYRRGHALHQALKTCGTPSKLHNKASFPPTFEAYCEAGLDLFGLVQHFNNWRAGADTYPVILVKYENMFDLPVADALFSHICASKHLPKEQVSTLARKWCASKRDRKSQVPEACRSSGMYSGLQDVMQSLPPLVVVPPRQGVK